MSRRRPRLPRRRSPPPRGERERPAIRILLRPCLNLPLRPPLTPLLSLSPFFLLPSSLACSLAFFSLSVHPLVSLVTMYRSSRRTWGGQSLRQISVTPCSLCRCAVPVQTYLKSTSRTPGATLEKLPLHPRGYFRQPHSHLLGGGG